MDAKDIEPTIGELFDYSVKIRGVTLTKTVHIERLMDDFISMYFCKTLQKKIQLCELWLWNEKANFDGKKEILAAIVSENEFKFFIDNHPDFLKSMNKIAPHRNVFAHLEIDLNLEDFTKKRQIQFNSYRGGKPKKKVYSPQDITELNNYMTIAIAGLKALIIAMPPLS